MSGLRFSIVTCTWNSARYLQQCITSVKAQTYDEIQHVFIDGGSTDGTLDIIRSAYPGATIVEGIRGGIARAMNEGIRAATGDVVAHLHSDDYYIAPDVIARVAETFDRERCDWLFGRIVSDVEGNLVPEPYVAPDYSYRQLLRYNFIPHPATFVRRELFQRAGVFDETIRYAMDYDLWLRLGRISAPVQLRSPLAAFRRHAGSTTEANRLASHRDDFEVRMRYAGWSPVTRLEHLARYLIRRRRIARELTPTTGAP
jgi:glycosyltransferase involved in cell wall biosynthesis